jgi:protein ImuB
MRLACLHVPAFPLAALLRADPELRGEPLAVTQGRGPRARVVACSPEAVERGIAVGLSAAQAKAIHAGILLRAASPDGERAARNALCDAAYSFSPRMEDGGGGTVYLDIGDSMALHGSEHDLARSLVARARSLGLDAAVGVASTKIAAELAAGQGGIVVIPPREEWRFLAPLPLGLLSPSPALDQTLARWGIRSLGDLAALPASAVATRLGPEGAQLARRARGEDVHPLVPRPAPLDFEEAAELEYGVETLEPFLFVTRALLDRIIARLEVRGLVCGDLRLSLGLANRGRDERTVTVAAPGNDVKALLTLVRLHLEAHPPPEPVETVRLAAVAERLRAAQLDMFRPNGPAPHRLSLTLARLTSLCGAENIGAPVVADSHRPDAYGLRPFGPQAGVGCRVSGVGRQEEFRIKDPELETRLTPETRDPTPDTRFSGPRPSTPVLALRALRPARALEVFCDRGLPDFIRLADIERGRGAPSSTQHPTHDTRHPLCHGRVVTSAGPWRVQGEWWRAESFSRDYYDVQLSDGAVYRIFFDLPRQRWFVDGVYD